MKLQNQKIVKKMQNQTTKKEKMQTLMKLNYGTQKIFQAEVI